MRRVQSIPFNESLVMIRADGYGETGRDIGTSTVTRDIF